MSRYVEVATMRWDAGQYLRFEEERTRPVRDLLARVPEPVDEPRIVDIGCGPGNSTAVLRRRWPKADLTGLDNSAEMLAAARGEGGEPSAQYVLADAADYDPREGRPDLIFSNATLQWVDGHLGLLSRWADGLRPGGVLAFQLPGNFDSPSHALLRQVAGSPRWRERLAGFGERARVHEPGEYLQTLVAAGCAVDVWETTYYSLLGGADPVLEWVKGTALRPVLSRLTEEESGRFLAEYGALLRAAYPAGPNGTVFPFRRIFAVAIKR